MQYRSQGWILAAFILMVACPSLFGMPMFARKYQVDCTMCHAAVPRLNFTGIKFKAAGYRMAWEVGKDQDSQKLILQNYNAFMAYITMPYEMHVGANTPPSSLYLNAQELDVHPITGSWDRHWGTGFEADWFPNSTLSLNQAFGTYTEGTSETFFTLQAGLVPTYLGYGPFDRPIAVSAPLILAASAGNSSLNTLFNFISPRAAGLTGLFWSDNFYVTASFRNRLTNNNGTLDALASTSGNMGDFLISGSYFYNTDGSGSAITPYYYHGQSNIPVSTQTGASLYWNMFDRVGIVVNNYLTDNWNAFVGGGWGQDQAYNVGSNQISGHIFSQGLFGGIEYFWSPWTMAGARVDEYVSDRLVKNSETWEATLYTYWRIINQVILSGEYQYQTNGSQSTVNSQDQSLLTAQLLIIF